MNDLRELNASEKKHFGACWQLAKDFFTQKPKEKAYRVEGYYANSGTRHKRGTTCIEYVNLTDEQVAAVKANPELISAYRREKGVVTTKIDFDDYFFTCHFSFCYFDNERQEMTGPLPFEYLFLSDNDYIYLLALELSEPHGITYNRLVEIDPEWVAHLNSMVNFEFEEAGHMPKPFLVIFDEIVEDVRRLRARMQ